MLAAMPVAAQCTGLPASVNEVADASSVIVVGRVVASRFDGTAYDIDVERVVRGDMKVGRWSFGPANDPGARSSTCLADLMPVGQLVVLAVQPTPTETDHAFVGYFWWPIAADGTVGLVSTGQTQRTLDALLAALGADMPATDVASPSAEDMPASPSPPPAGILALVTLTAFAIGHRWYAAARHR
jgi:hypothetical protein